MTQAAQSQMISSTDALGDAPSAGAVLDTYRTIGPDRVVDGPIPAIETWVRLLSGVAWMGICGGLLLIALLVCLPSRSTRIRIGNLYGSMTGSVGAWLTGSRYVIRGEQHADGDRPAIYISNHASVIDILLGIWLSPYGTCGVGKKEVIYYPFFGQFFWLAGHLRIDRSNKDSAITALKGLADLVRRNSLSIFIWPEGTRSRDGRISVFKKGAFHLALATGLPLVPMVVSGSQRAWQGKSLRIYRTTVDVKFLPAIETTNWNRDNLEQHIEDVRQVFIRELPEDQRPLKTSPVAAV